ncbi:MAG TPA: S28 family serine protease [Kofleriaceae bacterium]
MNRVVGFIVAALVVGSGCGDNPGPRGLSQAELLARLRALDGVKVDEASTEQSGLSYYILHFTQPIDHEDPSLGTFQQQVSLLHRSERAPTPMIVHTTGYEDSYHDTPVELTNLLSANQVSIEHRYFGTSRPVPTDWSKLTIKQMADDEHAIITALKTIYDGAFLTTGSSKGGMTAVFHRKYYPADVDGTVAYVAPISFGAPDTRYPGFFDTVGTEQCRRAVRNLAIEMLAHRRDQFERFAADQPGNAYTRVALGPAVEAAIAGFEWAFWQYRGSDQCANVPTVTASDADVFAFLDWVSPIHDSSDADIATHEAYYYQTYSQLGYPDYSVAYLAPYLRYQDTDYAGELPTVEPVYDAAAMPDVLDYIDLTSDGLLFIYGQWDPWTAGKVVLGSAPEAKSFVKPEGTHLSQLVELKQADCNTALWMIEQWTGVTPRTTWWRRAGGSKVNDTRPPPREPRVRPVLVRAPTGGR